MEKIGELKNNMEGHDPENIHNQDDTGLYYNFFQVTFAKHSKALNSRFILAGWMCGRGSAGLETICGVVGLPPVFPKCYTEHNLIIHKIVQEVCEESSRSALHSCVDYRVPIQMMLLMSQSHVMVPGLIVGLWRIMVWWQCCHGDRSGTWCGGPEQIMQGGWT